MSQNSDQTTQTYNQRLSHCNQIVSRKKKQIASKNYGDNIGERKKWREPKLESKNKLMIGERKSETIICVDDDDDDDDNEKNRWPKQNR